MEELIRFYGMIIIANIYINSTIESKVVKLAFGIGWGLLALFIASN